MTEEYAGVPDRCWRATRCAAGVHLLGAGRPVLTHCFAGKDRTGFMVAVVLEAIGVDRDAI